MMREKPNGFWDLVIADPPYGIGEDGGKNHTRGKQDIKSKPASKSKAVSKSKVYEAKGWDNEPPPVEFFNELLRVSKNQIIFGANHFIDKIPRPSSCWIVWDKMNGENDFADCELACTSFKSAVRKFEFRWNGMLQGDMKNKEMRIHPTQKPVALYKWLLQNYAKPGDKILDPMMGSGSSRIAAWDMGFEYWGCELDSDYFSGQEKRFAAHTAKPLLFQPGEMYNFEQTKLFTE